MPNWHHSNEVFAIFTTPSIPKKASQLFLYTDESIAKTYLYTSVFRQSWEAFLGTEGVFSLLDN